MSAFAATGAIGVAISTSTVGAGGASAFATTAATNGVSLFASTIGLAELTVAGAVATGGEGAAGFESTAADGAVDAVSAGGGGGKIVLPRFANRRAIFSTLPSA